MITNRVINPQIYYYNTYNFQPVSCEQLYILNDGYCLIYDFIPDANCCSISFDIYCEEGLPAILSIIANPQISSIESLMSSFDSYSEGEYLFGVTTKPNSNNKITIDKTFIDSNISSNGHLYLTIKYMSTIRSFIAFSSLNAQELIISDEGLMPNHSFEDYSLDLANLKIDRGNGKSFLTIAQFQTNDPLTPINISFSYNEDAGLRHNYQISINEINDDEFLLINPTGYKENFIKINNEDLPKYDIDEPFQEGDVFYYSSISSSYAYKRSNRLHIVNRNDETYIFYEGKLDSITFCHETLSFLYQNNLLTSISNTRETVNLYYFNGELSCISSANINLPMLMISHSNNSYTFLTYINNILINHTVLELGNDYLDGYITKIKDLISNNYYELNYNSNLEVSNISFKKHTDNDEILIYEDYYSYNDNKTTVTNSLDQRKVYYFDNYLRLVTLIDENNKVISYSYEPLEEHYSSNISSINKAISIRRNYIENHLFEKGFDSWNFSNDDTYSISSNSIYGSSLCVETNANQTLTITQAIVDPKRGTYKLKAFLKLEEIGFEGIVISLKATYSTVPLVDPLSMSSINGTNAIIPPIHPIGNETITKSITISDIDEYKEYQLDDLTIPNSATLISELLITISIPSNTKVYFDYFSFDEELDPKVNLLSNGYLEKLNENNFPSSWGFLENSSEDGYSFINSVNEFSLLDNNVRSIKFPSKTFDGTDRGIMQTVNISGKRNDKYTLSVISRSLTSSNTKYQAYISFVGTETKTYYFDFIKDYSSYQLLTRSITSEIDYNSIEVGVIFNGSEEVIFDSFELLKEASYLDISHDSFNNVSFSSSSYLGYKKNKVIASISNDGDLSIYEYDDRNNLIGITRDDNLSIRNFYDDDNHLISSTLSCEGEEISRSRNYQNLLLAQSIDEHQNITSYEYEDITNRLSNKILGNSKESYSYNNKNDLTQISILNNSNDHLLSSNSIYYLNNGNIDELSSSNGSVYQNVYDELDEVIEIKIPDTDITYESFFYNHINHLLIENIINDTSITYSYNDKNLLSNLDIGAEYYRFIYDNNNRLIYIESFDDNVNYFSYYNDDKLYQEIGNDYKYIYSYDDKSRLLKETNIFNDYQIDINYQFKDTCHNAYYRYIKSILEKEKVDVILPFFPDNGLSGLSYSINNVSLEYNNEIKPHCYRLNNSSSSINIDLKTVYKNKLTQSFANDFLRKKTFLLWARVNQDTDNLFVFKSGDSSLLNVSISSGHIVLNNRSPISSQVIRIGEYNLIAISIETDLINTSETIVKTSINGNDYVTSNLSINASIIDNVSLSTSNGSTLFISSLIIGSEITSLNEIYNKGIESFNYVNKEYKDGFTFFNPYVYKNKNLYYFLDDIVSNNIESISSNSTYDKNDLRYNYLTNRNTLLLQDDTRFILNHDIANKGVLSFKIKLNSRSSDTSASFNRHLFNFYDSNNNSVFGLYFSKTNFLVKINGSLYRYAYSSRGNYINVKVFINSNDVQVSVGTSSIKTISQTLDLSNTTLYLFNDKNHNASIYGEVDYFVIGNKELSTNNRTGLSNNIPTSIYYSLDKLNRITNISNSLSNRSISYSYDKYRISSETHSNNDIYSYNYDSSSRLSSIYKNDSLLRFYEYDELGRLTNDNGSSISYDSNGNILSKENHNYLYNNVIKDRLETILDSSNNVIYQFDYPNDSLYPSSITKNGVTNNLFWLANRLIGYGNSSYTYDYMGRRRTKTVAIPEEQLPIYKRYVYHYKENKLVFLGEEPSLSGDGIYFFYLNDKLYSACYKNNTYFYIHDAFGNIISITNSSGVSIVNFTYDAFGKSIESNKTTNSTYLSFLNLQPFRYKDYIYDEETGLYWLFSRYYDPEIGRFISPDSVDYLDPTSINGLNLYAYCNNDPVNYCDPSGHFGVLAAIFIGLGASVLVGGGLVLGGRLSGNETLTNIGDVIISSGEIVAGIAMIATGVGDPLGMGLLGTGVGSISNGLINCSNGGTFHGGWAGGQLAGALSFIPYFGGAIGAFGGSVLTDLIDSDYSLSKIDLGKAGASAALAFGLSWFGNTITWSGIPLDKATQYVLSYDYALLSIANSIINVYWRGRNQ